MHKALGLLILSLSISANMACASSYPEVRVALGMPVSEFNAQPSVKAIGSSLNDGPASMWGTDDYVELLVTVNGTVQKFEIRNKFGLYLTSSNLEGPERPQGPTTISSISFGTDYIGDADFARQRAHEICGKFEKPPVGTSPKPYHVAYPAKKWSEGSSSSDLLDRHERVCEIEAGFEAIAVDIERSTIKDDDRWRVWINLQSTIAFQGTDIRPF